MSSPPPQKENFVIFTFINCILKSKYLLDVEHFLECLEYLLVVVIKFLLHRDQIYVPHSLQVSNNSLSNVVRNLRLSPNILQDPVTWYQWVTPGSCNTGLPRPSWHLTATYSAWLALQSPSVLFTPLIHSPIVSYRQQRLKNIIQRKDLLKIDVTSDLQGWEGRN